MPAKSKQQQKFMGIVRAIQQGDEPASKFSKSAQDAAEDMKEKDVEDFASTKHKGLPKKVEQYIRQKIRKSVEEMIKEDWFDRLSSDDQKKYVKDHPGSKKAKQAAHDKEREKRARKIRSKNYTVDGDGNIVKVKKTKEDPKKHAKHMAALKKGYMPGDDNYERFVKEDYVETCGYTQSVDGKKLKTPGGTGKEDRKLKEGLPTKIKDLRKIKKIKPEPDSQKGTSDSIATFTKHHAGSMGAGDMGRIAEPDTYDWDDSGSEPNTAGHQTKKNKKKKGWEPVEESVNENILIKQLSKMINEPGSSINKYIKQQGLHNADLLDFVEKLTRNSSSKRKKHIKILKLALKGNKKAEKFIMKTLYGESVNEAFTSGDRKTLMVIGRDFVQYWDSQFIKGLGKKEIRGLKQGLPQLLSVLGRPEDKRYNRFKTTMRTNPILRKYNDKLLARLSKGFDSERTNVKKKFVDNLIKYSLKESVVKEARRITRGNRGVKVGDTVKFFDRDRNPAHYRGKVKWIMKAKKNKEFVDFIYITAKGNYTDQHLDGTKAYKWHYRRREGVNERVSNSEAKVILSQLGGSKFIAMTGAKNFGVGNEGLSMSIGKNSKRITHFIVDYNRGKDLYNLEFVRMWGGRRISVKKLKGVYFDDLQYNFKRYTGLNTRL